ncbi:hypothetical protein [Streptomyces sp. NPDC031705]|uniref:hypothetical protein n=1 Tax=Streptomyces sp. NPDC031705 TaxID=3155729 RepID=UPI0033F2A45A
MAEALAARGGAASRDGLAKLLGAADGEAARGLDFTLETLADHALVWPDGAAALRMASPLQQAWEAPLGLDAPLEKLLAGATSEELRAMLVALGIKPPSTRQQRLATLVEHHSDPGAVAEVVARAPEITRELLARRADSTAGQRQFIMFGSSGPKLEPGARWALDRGLLIVDRHRYGPARMPVEVALALRGPIWHAPFDPRPPSRAVHGHRLRRGGAGGSSRGHGVRRPGRVGPGRLFGVSAGQTHIRRDRRP